MRLAAAGADAVPVVAANTVKKQPQEIRFDLLSAARTTMVYGGLHVEPVKNATGYTLLVRAKDLQFTQTPDGSRLADVTVLSGDILTMPEDEILSTDVVYTIVGGKVVFQR